MMTGSGQRIGKYFWTLLEKVRFVQEFFLRVKKSIGKAKHIS